MRLPLLQASKEAWGRPAQGTLVYTVSSDTHGVFVVALQLSTVYIQQTNSFLSLSELTHYPQTIPFHPQTQLQVHGDEVLAASCCLWESFRYLPPVPP